MYRFLVLGIGYLGALARAQGYYMLQDSFLGGPTFLDHFDFWTSWHPTYGFVHYVDQAVAEQYHMINVTDSTVSWGVDTTQILDPDANLGRLSIRLTSVQTYTHGLFVLDLAHMPDAVCGSWPSFWSLGGTGVWPASGEIDIIEMVNQQTDNLMSLHTMPGCSIAGDDETGTLISSDCGLGGGFAGCSVEANSPSNSGSSFNAIGGGVYAMEWTSEAIRVWFFPRSAIPETLLTPFPDVSTFGVPTANFEGSCNIDTYFFDHNLIFDIDFCGSWAGPTFQIDGCPALDPNNSWSSCNEFVALNPLAFTESYWEVNYLNVYQLLPGTAPTTSISLSSVTPAISTSPVSTALGGAQGRSTTPTMSIAGTTPVITTASSTSISSVLSAGTSSPVVPLSADASIHSSPTAPAASTTPIPTSLPSTTTSETPQNPNSCTGNVCTSFITVVVVQTIVVDMLMPASPRVVAHTEVEGSLAPTPPSWLSGTASNMAESMLNSLPDNSSAFRSDAEDIAVGWQHWTALVVLVMGGLL